MVVDETADIVKAAHQVFAGATFDNNMPCICEKEVFVVREVAEQFISAMQERGAYLLSDSELDAVVRVVTTDDGHVNRDFVGKDCEVILRSAGINPPAGVELAICHTQLSHPFVQHELLMPLLAIVTVNDFSEAIRQAKEAEHGFGHTASMYSKNLDALHRMARVMDVSIFVKNAPNYAGLGFGGEGFTSFTIASPTGEGLTTAIDFTRVRRCTLAGYFRIV